MASYSERVAEPLDLTPLMPEPLSLGEDTPSPRTPSSVGSPPVQEITQLRPLIPVSAEEGIPYDHTLPDFIRNVAGQPTLSDIQSMTLRVLTEASSLQQMTMYTPYLRELNLEGSAIISLRDIGSQLGHLHVLKVNRCHLVSLDGTLSFLNLRQLYAAGNAISSAAPCSLLSHLRLLDISSNLLEDVRSLSFLTRCRSLRRLCLAGNPFRTQQTVRDVVQATLPALEYLDDVHLAAQTGANGMEQSGDSPRVLESTESSRVSSASSCSLANGDRQSDSQLSDGELSGQVVSDGAVSSLTSGKIVCGSLLPARRTQSQPADAFPNSDALEASRRWRVAYHRFREVNSARWEEEAQETTAGSEDDNRMGEQVQGGDT